MSEMHTGGAGAHFLVLRVIDVGVFVLHLFEHVTALISLKPWTFHCPRCCPNIAVSVHGGLTVVSSHSAAVPTATTSGYSLRSARGQCKIFGSARHVGNARYLLLYRYCVSIHVWLRDN